MSRIKKIPYGRTDLETIIREDYYYVDKTRFIPKLEDEGSYVIFLRPRRYGKSLTIAMLDAYYNIRYADSFEELFGNLYIGQNPTEKHNTYLVLSLNFSAVDSDKDKVEESFNTNLLYAFQRFAYQYRDILPEGTEERMEAHTKSNDAFNDLCSLVAKTNRKMYVMIDEYDNFANTLMSYDEGAYRDLTHGDGFFRLFFNSLKAATTGNNTPIDRMYISGVSPLTLSDVTSGFNIGDNFSTLPDYNEMVGFSENEVREMLEYYRDSTGHFNHSVDELIDIMKPWYNNNCFSDLCVDDQRMFNSDMVLYFLSEYIGAEGTIPKNMIAPDVSCYYRELRHKIGLGYRYDQKTKMMQKILENGHIHTILRPELSISRLHFPENFPSLLYYTGLLTYGYASDGSAALVLPNLMARSVIEEWQKQ